MIPPISASLTGGAGGSARAGDLSDYFNSNNSGYRGPIVNIGTGSSRVSPETSATAGISTTTLLLAAAGIFLALRFMGRRS